MIELNNHFLALFLGWEEALAEAPPASTVAPMSCSGAAAFALNLSSFVWGNMSHVFVSTGRVNPLEVISLSSTLASCFNDVVPIHQKAIWEHS